ncbi:site-specific DNA-methyltransferase [Xylanibacter brevis]|uniref:site-specific DNA-methyltransferase n=1 Tax=Xylanibacter brevis TaxID=83231 RepID=UPI000694AFB1|nr:site-specific DNA-methyltransferase [Xylanibacter brevis]
MDINKMKMQTRDGVADNISWISEKFPNCVTEKIDAATGEVKLAVDFDMLRQELSSEIVEGKDERYQFVWPDKKKAILLANAPINATLRPCEEESEDFANTQNLYIEGDNLDVLKCLKETYLGKIKMIYIDPPYNTGSDLLYNDSFGDSYEDYIEFSGQYDELGNRLVPNLESNGRFHTSWLNMIYPRLRVSRDLLKDDGVIFISIGEGEIENITKCADEVFGESNRIGIVPRVMKSGGGKGFFFSPNIDYIIIYAKNINSVTSFREPISEDIINRLYTSIETTGDRKGERYRPFGLYQSSLDSRPNQRYYIEAPDGSLIIPPGNAMPEENKDGAFVIPKSNEDKVWRWSRERYLEEKAKGNIEFKKSDGVLIDSNGKPAKWNVYTKIWLSDRQEEGMTPVNFITKYENRHSAKELKELDIPFDFAKPVGLIAFLMQLLSFNKEEIILDYFSGSATTAHAVMQLNAQDNGKRRFIMVQLPEETDKKSEAYKAGYKNICEIGKERIRRAGKKIKSESPLTTQDLDVGFRVLKLDSTNMEDVYYAPAEVKQEQLNLFADNVKPDRTGEDLLFQSMLDLGATLDSKIEKIEVNGKVVYNVAEGYLVACFDKEVSDDVVKAIAQMQPQYAVLRDSSLADDSTATNFEQIFKTFSPTTTCKIL